MTRLINKRLNELRSLDQSEDIRNTLKRYWKIKEKKTLLWQIKPKTAKKIYNLSKKQQPKLILELGTSAGYSTLIMAKATTEKTKIHTIECIPYRIDLAKESFEKTNLKNRIILHEGKIKDIIEKWDTKNKVDLLFLDADKENYLDNTKKIIPFLSKNAIIIADNMLDNPKKTEEYIKYVKSLKEFSTKVYKIDNGVLVAKRI